jgi:hypothetical protein
MWRTRSSRTEFFAEARTLAIGRALRPITTSLAAGAAVVAAQEGIELRRLAYYQGKGLEIAHSQRLSRTVGANCHKATVT